MEAQEMHGLGIDNPQDGIVTDGSTLTDSEKERSLEDVEQTAALASVDVPPDGGYGWVCVVCVALINGHTWGVNSVGDHMRQSTLNMIQYKYQY